ncbi:uncharacterized protein A1O9_00866 [Exophiala aquamarina CBS 119918]|uniref:Choloylglycine hydrolase/NAAA C-terminal domain-containing protein n=1 Tax=Exophiala aquamarina CBS 119918 TaxID=1182545 RepID=A0A072PT27_9EURO|nr:uncharacterized protein A1O9_00866 [Exophiala aquamarina CBS 119918]KEF62892.1 hypothetical protein A1O9_00866 [Exophiala aquamarina CBS 119918]
MVQLLGYIILCLLNLFYSRTHACTRVSYTSGVEDGHRVIIGRTLDWNIPPYSSIYAFPAGITRNGSAGENSLEWTSKYGSVVITMNDALTFDGLNTEGLHGGLLYLTGTDFGDRNTSLPGLSVSFWVQYFLDSYASVAEVRADILNPSGEQRFQVRTRGIIPGLATVVHLVLGDASGDNLIMEYLDGKLYLYQSPEYHVITNEPTYDQQLALQEYWRNRAEWTLPGTAGPVDRFARMADNLRRAPVATTMVEAVRIVQSLVRSISVTLRTQATSVSNAPSLWRILADTKDKRYFYESATDGVSLWINMSALDLGTRGNTKRMSLDAGSAGLYGRYGDATEDFVNAEPYTPILANSETGDGFGGTGPVDIIGLPNITMVR